MKMGRKAFCSMAVCAALASGLDAVPAERIDCAGAYGGHLQGVATDGKYIYWSFTVEIVKTDLKGNILATQTAPSHQGDLCVKDSIVYVAVNRGRFNFENAAVSEVRSYDAGTLEHLKTWSLPQMPHGAGGMTWRGDRFFVVGGLPATHERNYVYEYTADFEFVKRHDLETGFTLMGIQTAAYEDGRFLFGIYGGKGNPAGVLEVNDDLATFGRFLGPGCVGMLKLGDVCYAGRTDVVEGPKRNRGYLVRVPAFCIEKNRYSPRKKGGKVRIFFAGRDKTGWTDSGYQLNGNGYRPLTQIDDVYSPVKSCGGCQKDLPAVCLGGGQRFSVPDLMRGVRRAASEDEVLGICFAGTPESVAADPALSAALAAIRQEAKALDVSVVGL